MKHSYLEVTFCKGRPLAAYYYRPRREGDRSVRTARVGGLVVDFAAHGWAIGIEITSPSRLVLEEWSQVLVRLGQVPMGKEDLAPLAEACGWGRGWGRGLVARLRLQRGPAAVQSGGPTELRALRVA